MGQVVFSALKIAIKYLLLYCFTSTYENSIRKEAVRLK